MRQGRRSAAWGRPWLRVSGVALLGGAVAWSAAAQDAEPVEPSAVPGGSVAGEVAEVAGVESVPGSLAVGSPMSDSVMSSSTAPRLETPTAAAARPTVEPLSRPWVQGRDTRVGMPAASVDLDPAVIGPMPEGATPTLYREGDFVVDRLGRLRELPNGATAFVFVEATADDATDVSLDDAGELRPGARAMVLQPCQRLETMLSAAEQQQDRGARFRLTGQVHVYRGVNYLLPTELTGYQAEPLPPSDAPPSGVSDAPRELPDAEAGLDAPEPSAVGVQTPVQPRNPQDLMNAMAAELDAMTQENDAVGARGSYGGISAPLNPQRVRQATTTQPGAGRSVGSAALNGGPLLREGEMVLSRAGRLVRSADRREVVFAFEADGPGLVEPPMGVLPCRLRMWMEDTVARQGDGAVFVVSGRVYQFRGSNYLLPSVVKLRP